MTTLSVIAGWAAMAGLYLLLAGEVSRSEIIAGFFVTAASVFYALVLRHVAGHRWSFRAPWIHVLGRPLAALFPDAVRVGRVLLRAIWSRPERPMGVVSRQPFRPGGDDADAATRRALVTLGSSFAPNGYVLHVAAQPQSLLLHRLAPVPPEPDRDWPI